MKKKPLDLVAIFPQINDIHDESLRIAVTEVWDELWRRSSWLDINAMPTSVEVPSYPHIPPQPSRPDHGLGRRRHV